MEEHIENIERHLIHDLKQGSHKAFDKIYQMYSKRLYAYSLQFTKSSEESEEIVQEVFVKLWSNRINIRQDETLRSLLFIMAKHRLINAYRQKINHPIYEEYIYHIDTLSTEDTHYKLEYNEFLFRFLKTIEKLPDTQQKVIRLSRFKQLSNKEIAEKRAENAETELKKLEDRREFLQPVMDNVSKEIKEYGMIKTFLPEATALERAVTYRDKKIKPLFIEMKNKIGAMAAQVKELTRERDSWKSKFQKKKQEHEKTKKELAEVQKDYQKLSGEKEILQGLADRYNRLLRMLGKDMVERLVQDDIRMQAELEAKKQKEQMPKKIGDRIQWARERSEEYNAQIKKNKTKYRGMEL